MRAYKLNSASFTRFAVAHSFVVCRLREEEVCPEQIEAALTFCDSPTVKNAAGVVKELEAKLKEMKPSRSAITEYGAE